MTIKPVHWRWAACVLAVTSLVSAAPVPHLALGELVQMADIVVAGTVTDVAEKGAVALSTANGTVPARLMTGALSVDVVLKGSVQSSSLDFQFSIPDVPIGFAGIQLDVYRVFFLKLAGTTYELASPYRPSIVGVRSRAVRSSETIDKVLEMVAAVLRTDTTDDEMKLEACHALWGNTSAEAVTGLRAALKSRNQSVALTAAAALLSNGDQTAWQLAETALTRSDGSISPEVLHNLRVALSEKPASDAAIAARARLLRAGDVETRRAVSVSLRRLRSPLAVESLTRALDDDDVEVRYSAVMGLAESTGRNEWGPSMPAFLEDQQRYIRLWKEWAIKR